MKLKQALKLTGTINRLQLTKYLNSRGYSISSAAVYKWGDDIPDSGIITILKAIDAYPDLDAIIEKRLKKCKRGKNAIRKERNK